LEVCGRRPRARGATFMGSASENLHKTRPVGVPDLHLLLVASQARPRRIKEITRRAYARGGLAHHDARGLRIVPA
jgi:hypothetical protein